MLFSLFHLGECHGFLVSGHPQGKGCYQGLSLKVIVPFPLILTTFHHFFPSVSSSFGFSGHIDPRRVCTSFHGKKGLKAQRLVVGKR
jgi:hypothetical protein